MEISHGPPCKLGTRRLVPNEPFPAYSYVTGRYPHPTRDQAGHSFGVAPVPCSRRIRSNGTSAIRIYSDWTFSITVTIGRPTKSGKGSGTPADALVRLASSSRGSSNWPPLVSRLAKVGPKESAGTDGEPRNCSAKLPAFSGPGKIGISDFRSNF